MTTSMIAISQDTLGGPSVLHPISQDRPEPAPGEILIRVRAAGINPTDGQHREHGIFLGQPPFTVGWDVSGTVAATGIGVTLFEVGDEVFGMLPYPHRAGAYAEFVTGPVRAFAPKPTTLTHAEAAALPMAGLVAWQALVDTAHLQPGQRVLVHGGSGGIGHLAVQIARALGAHVSATASGDKRELVRELGAAQVIDFRTERFEDIVTELDVIIDPVGGDTRLRSLPLLNAGGILVSSIPDDQSEVRARAADLGVRTAALIVEHDRTGMLALADLAAEGKLHPHVAATFPLADAALAHELAESGTVGGKIVLTVSENNA